MTVLVLVALPDPHSELQEPQELHEDTWQSITGQRGQMNKGIVFDGPMGCIMSLFASTCVVFSWMVHMYEVL